MKDKDALGDFIKSLELTKTTVDVPFFVRLDGWAFHTFVKEMGYKKPYDPNLMIQMTTTAEQFMREFHPTIGYTFSDEASFLFTKPTIFSRVQKLDSLFAGFYSAIFNRDYAPSSPAIFDCRVIPMKPEDIMSYLQWRHTECRKNHNNVYSEWIMREKKGLSPAAAAKSLSGLKSKDLKVLCSENGVNLATTPAWQRNGVFLYSTIIKRKGFNPITKEEVLVDRNTIATDWETPNLQTPTGIDYINKAFGVL